MAQVKVVRRSMRPEEWTDLRFGWLKRYVYRKKFEVKNLRVADARQVGEDSYEFPDGSDTLTGKALRELQKGDEYFTPDGTVFIRAKLRIPDKLLDEELWLTMKTSAEFIVKINGVYAGGLDPNRDRVLISDGKAPAPKVLYIELEGYNRSKPDDERTPEIMAERGCRQVFDGLYIALVDHDVQSLIYDFEAFINIRDSERFDPDYRAFLTKELKNAMDLIVFPEERPGDGMKRPEGVAAAADYLESRVYSNRNYRGSGAVALVGHSHLDIAYYWRRIHSVQKNLRTVIIQLRLMDRYPEFRYVHTQPYLYETLEKYYPDVFEELRQRVASGQFEPAGGMYVEPDCNIPSAESLIRQCLYGQMTYKRMFGKFVNNAWLPDVFGNSWILPQILKKSGMEYFVSNKMSTWNATNRFPHNNFIWRGIDGTEVLACVPPTHFISWNEPDQVQANWDAFQEKDSGGATLNMFGYGDGGSGVTEEMLELADRFKKITAMPRTRIIGGSEYLQRHLGGCSDKLDVWDGELYLEMHRGALTTKSDLKYRNRRLEFMFRDAELLSCFAGTDNTAYITPVYKRFLVNQFHDILPGSHIRPVYEDAVNDLDQVEASLGELIAGLTGCDGTVETVSYFNTLNFKREGPEFIETPYGADTRRGRRGYWSKPTAEALSISFTPPLDDPVPEEEAAPGPAVTWSNEFYHVIFAPDGSFKSLYDKQLRREWVDGEFGKLKLYDDRPGNYDAWDILPDYKKRELPYTVERPLKFDGVFGGAARFSAVLATEKSSWEIIIRFFEHSRMIETEHIVDWRESHVLAKLRFDCAVLARKAQCDTSAGFIERDTGANTSWQAAKFETCMHKWCDLSETNAGIAFINDGKYGVGFEGGSVGISMLRAPERPDPTSDIGIHDLCLRIYPHEGTPQQARVNALAYEYNSPLVPVRRPDFGARLPETLDRLLTVVGDKLFLQSVKYSEDGRMLVVRFSEQDGARGSIRLPARVRLLNMLEEPVGFIGRLDYKPFEIITIGC